jgi:hypothetical protein
MTLTTVQDKAQTQSRKPPCRHNEIREREVLRLAIRAVLQVQAQRSNSLDIRIAPMDQRQSLWLDA